MNWHSKHQNFVKNKNRRILLSDSATEKFLPLYRALAAILGSKRMTSEQNTDLEKSGFADLFDLLMSMHFNGGLPDEVIDRLERFQKSGNINTGEETYVVDISTQRVLSLFRKATCK